MLCAKSLENLELKICVSNMIFLFWKLNNWPKIERKNYRFRISSLPHRYFHLKSSTMYRSRCPWSVFHVTISSVRKRICLRGTGGNVFISGAEFPFVLAAGKRKRTFSTWRKVTRGNLTEKSLLEKRASPNSVRDMNRGTMPRIVFPCDGFRD